MKHRRAAGRLATAACIVAGAVLGAGHPAGAALPPHYDSQLILLAAGPVATLDPAQARSAAELDLVAALFEGLVRAGPAGPEPAAAAGWTASADALHWTFRLRPGVRFSDGAPVDAAACLASWKRRARQAPLRAPLLDGVTPVVVDSLTLRLDLARPIPDLLGRLASPEASIVHEVYAGGVATATSLRGSGPFRFAGMKEGGFLLAPRLDYHDGRPLPARVLVRVAAAGIPAGVDTTGASPTAVLVHSAGGGLAAGPRVSSVRGSPRADRLADIWVRP